MIVVDTNVIAYLYLEGEYTKNAEALLEQDANWIVPNLWRSEFRNVLALYLRKKIVTYPHALQIIEQAEEFLEGNEYLITSEEVLNLVQRSTCSAYDCEFIYLSQKFDIPLVTADKKILTEFPDNCISLKTIKNS